PGLRDRAANGREGALRLVRGSRPAGLVPVLEGARREGEHDETEREHDERLETDRDDLVTERDRGPLRRRPEDGATDRIDAVGGRVEPGEHGHPERKAD